jgi:phenylalanyl-tRNA synthetase beta chain
LPDLLKNAAYNLNHGQKDIKTFEMAKLFFRENQKLAEETYQVTGLLIGNTHETYWKSPSREIDFFDVKGLLNAVFNFLDLSEIKYEKSIEPYYQEGIGADVIYSDNKIASLGKIDPLILREFDIEQTTFSFDIAIGKILKLHRKELPVFKEIPKFPPVLRDISFVISRNYNLTEIETVIKNTNKNLISKVVLFDEYTGKNIEPDKRSLSFNIVFSSPTKTLTDEFINGIISMVIKNLETEFDINLR